jgi:hypothetical protein
MLKVVLAVASGLDQGLLVGRGGLRGGGRGGVKRGMKKGVGVMERKRGEEERGVGSDREKKRRERN